MLLPSNNLHFCIPGPSAAKALLMCTGPAAAAGGEGHGMEALLLCLRSQALWFSDCSSPLSKAAGYRERRVSQGPDLTPHTHVLILKQGVTQLVAIPLFRLHTSVDLSNTVPLL